MNLTYKISKNQTSIGQTLDIFDKDINIRVGIFEFHKLPEYPDVIEIDRLYIETKFQKQGIGTFIVKSIFEHFKPNMIIACCLSVQFWLKLGFQYSPEKWGMGYYECLRTDFLKKKKEMQRELLKQKNKNERIKPNAKRLMTMQYFGDMDESVLNEIIGNKLTFKQFNKLEGSNTEEKVKNIKKFWDKKNRK